MGFLEKDVDQMKAATLAIWVKWNDFFQFYWRLLNMMLSAAWKNGIYFIFVYCTFHNTKSEISTIERRIDERDIFGFVNSGICFPNSAIFPGTTRTRCQCSNSYSTFLRHKSGCLDNSEVEEILLNHSGIVCYVIKWGEHGGKRY